MDYVKLEKKKKKRCLSVEEHLHRQSTAVIVLEIHSLLFFVVASPHRQTHTLLPIYGLML